MPKFGKQTIAQSFKFNCDRFLRYQLSSSTERTALDIDKYALGKVRPGVQLMQEAGNKWEIDKYNDLILAFGEANVKFEREATIDPKLRVKKFKLTKNLASLLSVESPPKAIIEAEFKIPKSVSEELQEACERFDIEPSRAIPDIIWIRPYSTGSPLIEDSSDIAPQFELHIIDVKMASEASLKHFTEVTFYALALDAYIRENNLVDRYRVSARGLVWPGSHDINEFKNYIRKFEAEGNPDPVLESLSKTLIQVPYEIYEVHVKRFFKERLIPILERQVTDVSWHVSSKCQLCQYIEHCENMAAETDHLSRIPWLNTSQADLIRLEGINTTKDLAENIADNSELWKNVKKINHQLKADELGIRARCLALQDGSPKIITERVTHLMPNWVDMSIYLTVHFDPGSGITFAMGAKRVYFKPDRNKGVDAPIINEQVFIIDKVEQLSPDTERNRLIELITLVTSWLNEADGFNQNLRNQRIALRERDTAFGKVTAHIFFWSQLEVKHFSRMIERHMEHPDVVDKIELLIRLFPPEGILPPDIEYYKAQPGTVVKDVIKQLVGLPIAHDYTLYQTANSFFPNILADGTPYKYFNTYGFGTKLNDQIPFERAYELWKDDVFLKHSDSSGSARYTRDEIYGGIKKSISTYLNALQSVVMTLRNKCGSQLRLKKPPFSAAPISQIQVPETSKKLLMFNKLSSINQEIENIHKTSLPIDEREARFISIRGLIDKSAEYAQTIEDLRQENQKLILSSIYALEFSENSRDAKIKENDFLYCLTNESHNTNIYSYWYKELDLDYYSALQLLNDAGVSNPEQKVKMKFSQIFQVEIIKLNSTALKPYIVVAIPRFNDEMFQFGIDEGLLDLNSPMVLDPVYKDFETDDIERVLRIIGGRPKTRRARR